MSDAAPTMEAIPTSSRVTAVAAVLREGGSRLTLEDVVLSELADDEVLVRMVGVGVCHTDISAADGLVPLPLPAVLGHEGAGIVQATGPAVTALAVGDHVVLSYDYCGQCETCTTRTPAYCELFAPLNYFGERLDGTVTLYAGPEEIHGNWFGQSSFSTMAIANERNAVKVDPELPLELLGPLGCGFQTGAGSVLNVLRPRPGDSLAVFGMGAVGLAGVMAGRVAGCDPIIAIDPNPARLDLARELGATHTVDPTSSRDVVWDVMALVANGVDCSLDAVGAESVIGQALAVLRSPGHCVTVGFQGLEHPVTIDQGHLLLGRRLSGVIEGDAHPQTFVPTLIELHRQGRFPFDRLIKTFPLSQINAAMAASTSGEVVKPVVIFD